MADRVDGRSTPEARERAKAKLIQYDATQKAAAATRKHGLNGLMVDTSRWPSPLRDLYEERVAEILALPHIDPARHRGAVQQCARAEVIVATLYQWAAENKIIDGAGEPLPVLRTLPLWESHLARQYQLLGLVPYVNRRVIQRGDGMLGRIAGLDDATDAETEKVSDHA